MERQESLWARAYRDTNAALHSKAFLLGDLVISAGVGAALTSAGDSTSLRVAAAMAGGFVTFISLIGLWFIVNLPVAIAKQRSEARRLVADMQSRDGTISIEPIIDRGSALIRVHNHSQLSVDVQVQVEQVRGLASTKDEFYLPYTVPRLGRSESIPQTDWEARRQQRLLAGGSATVPLLSLYARQASPPHNMLRLWGIEYSLGWVWVHPESEDDQRIAFDLLILVSDSPPLRQMVGFRLKDRKFSVTAPATGEATDVVSELSDETKRVFLDNERHFRRGKVRVRRELPEAVLEELRRLGILEIRRVDLGWWDQYQHKGMADYYHLTRIGAQTLDHLTQDTSLSLNEAPVIRSA